MSINGNTKYRIANKWNDETKQFDKNQFEFENKGKFATGKLNWSIKKTDKEGATSFLNASMKFICFKETMVLMESNLGAKFTINASLEPVSFDGKDGKKVNYFQFIIYQADIVEQVIDAHNEAKGNAYQPEKKEEEILDDDIPF